nr:uncharacterized protein LOC109161160 isoform X1 [Ipomoea batatas]
MVAEKKEAAAGMESMAMGSGGGRSKPPLHNFTLPCGLKWGNQKFLRCAKLESDGEIGPVAQRRASEQLIGKRRSSEPRRVGSEERGGNFGAGVEDGIAAQRSPPETTTDATDSARRWNLRARRSGTKHPNGFSAFPGESNPGLKIDVTISAAVAGSSSGEKRDRAKFSLALSRREIEEDFAAIIHHRPPRRPKKRAKYVQKNLDIDERAEVHPVPGCKF